MSTIAQRNAAALKAMKRSHTVTVGEAKLEIQPPGIISIVERIEHEVPPEVVAGLFAGDIQVQALIQQFPKLARWLAVTSLAAKASEEELEDINDFVGSLSIEELFDLADGIIEVIMPEVENLKKKGLRISGRLGLEFGQKAAE